MLNLKLFFQIFPHRPHGLNYVVANSAFTLLSGVSTRQFIAALVSMNLNHRVRLRKCIIKHTFETGLNTNRLSGGNTRQHKKIVVKNTVYFLFAVIEYEQRGVFVAVRRHDLII